MTTDKTTTTFYAAAARKFQNDSAERGNELFTAQAEIEQLRAALSSANNMLALANAAAHEQHNRAEAWKMQANEYNYSALIFADNAETWKKIAQSVDETFRAELVEVAAQRDMLSGAMREYLSNLGKFGAELEILRDALSALDENATVGTVGDNHQNDACEFCGSEYINHIDGSFCCYDKRVQRDMREIEQIQSNILKNNS